jgi:hypothetical protein
MKSEEDEMSLTRWRRLLGTELTIALEEVSKMLKTVRINDTSDMFGIALNSTGQ